MRRGSIRKKQRQDYVDPHDEEPTFMRVVSNRPWNMSGGVSGLQTSNENTQNAAENNDVSLNENTVDADNMFYKVSAMHSWDTPDRIRKK